VRVGGGGYGVHPILAEIAWATVSSAEAFKRVKDGAGDLFGPCALAGSVAAIALATSVHAKV
jgi:hypothetical protein